MLIAHAASTCDVCLEGYSEDISYHTIPCGHVFCLPCLLSTDPSRCPLCRLEFTEDNMRRLHLTLPTERDQAARELEMKLVASSPDITLAESLSLFQDIQDWLKGEPNEDFLVLRAFAAVLCGFHETKDKLVHLQTLLEQTQARAEESQIEFRRSLEVARSPEPDPDLDDYKTKYREAELEITELHDECSKLRAAILESNERERQERVSSDRFRHQYKSTKSELSALRSECAALRAQVDKHQQDDQLRAAEYQAHCTQLQAQLQLQAQSQARAQEEAIARRNSNPLPPPPRPVDISFIKPLNARTTLWLKGEFDKADKGKGKDSSSLEALGDDPMSSVFVPTLAATIPSQPSSRHEHSDSEGHSEVTTLLYKPPQKVPSWEPQQQNAAHSSESDTSSVDMQAPRYVSQPGQSNDITPSRANHVSKQPQYAGISDSYTYVDRTVKRTAHHGSPRGHGDPVSHSKYPVWGDTGSRPQSFAAETGTLSRRPAWQTGDNVERSIRRASSPVVLDTGAPSDRMRSIPHKDESSSRRASLTRSQTVYTPSVHEAARPQLRTTSPGANIIRFRRAESYDESRGSHYDYDFDPPSMRIVLDKRQAPSSHSRETSPHRGQHSQETVDVHVAI